MGHHSVRYWLTVMQEGKMRARLAVLIAMACVLVAAGAAMAATINGTQGPDVIHGTGKADTISAGAGDDVVYGQGGNDTIRGNSGLDRLYGGLGNDYLSVGRDSGGAYGRAGNDTLLSTGAEFGAYLEGGRGNDTFWSDNSATVDPPVGTDDVISCGAGRDVVHGDEADEGKGSGAFEDAGCEVVYVNGELRWLNGEWVGG
jgi:Ca2+-binding RTX toxin-like protein